MQPGGAETADAAAPVDLEKERNRRLVLLLDGLDLINQGITVFDSRLKVVAANQRLLTMFGFPSDLARPGTDFADFVRYNAERGEYGPGDAGQQIEERVRLAREFKPHHFERTRPDGTIVTVTGAPISHGGWVTIYTDVTRLRNHEHRLEDEVRARTRDLHEANVRLTEANDGLRRASAEQKRLEAALVHAQRMEAVGALTGGLAHNFNNLLTIVISSLAALRDRAAAGTGSAELVESALAAALKGADITRRLLAFARQQPLEPRVVEINRLIAGVLALSRHSMPETIDIAAEAAARDLFVRVDPEQLEQALLNLALNARDAMPRGGRLAVRSTVRQLDEADACELRITPGSYVEVSVGDTGTGMDEATRARIFEPFFTTKSSDTGSGLGLSMVYGFVQQSGGAVQVRSTPGTGTTVTLLLPLSPPPEPDATSQPARPEGARQGARLVLLVEDNAGVRAVLRGQLVELGCMVIEAQGAQEALALIDGVPELSSMVVSDLARSGTVDGRRLAALASQRRPSLRIVLVTGHADGIEIPVDRPFALLGKPCTTQDLAAAIEATSRP